MTLPRVLFRVDAGPAIGLGHLQRCLSLAMGLRHLGASCVFLSNEESATSDRVRRFGFDGYVLEPAEPWEEEDLADTVALASESGCDAIVVDSYCTGSDYLRRLRRTGFLVCAIDDIAPYSYPCEIVVNGDAHAPQLDYQSSSGDTDFLVGPTYSMLRREFWQVPPYLVRATPQNILVALGGADSYNLMPRILAGLDALSQEFTMTAIIGPFVDNLPGVEEAVTRAQHSTRLIRSPDAVLELMLGADLAVSAGGQTLYELACVGCPTVAVKVASNQDRQLQAFIETGFIQPVGDAGDSRVVAAVGEAVLSLLPDCEARAGMSAAGRQLVDGQGALRVAQVILDRLLGSETEGR